MTPFYPLVNQTSTSILARKESFVAVNLLEAPESQETLSSISFTLKSIPILPLSCLFYKDILMKYLKKSLLLCYMVFR